MSHLQKVENWLETGMSPWKDQKIKCRSRDGKYSDPEVALTPHRRVQYVYTCRLCNKEHSRGVACQREHIVMVAPEFELHAQYAQCPDCGHFGHDRERNPQLCTALHRIPEAFCKICEGAHYEIDCPHVESYEAPTNTAENLQTAIQEIESLICQRQEGQEKLNEMGRALMRGNQEIQLRLHGVGKKIRKSQEEESLLME